MLQNFLHTIFMIIVPVCVAVPFLIALRLPPIQQGERYPSRRELTALLTALCLMPLMMYVTLSSGWGFIILNPALTLFSCVLLTAIAGRHPFLYSVLFSLFYSVIMVGILAVYDPIEWEQDRIFLQICFIVDPLVALVGATPLYLLWKAKG